MKNAKEKAPKKSSTGVEWDEVNRALDFMGRHGLEEFEFAKGDLRVRLKKPGAAGSSSLGAYSVPPNPSPPTGVHAAPSGSLAAPSSEKPKEDLHIVKSPIVGTFYLSPTPDAPPYVKVGDRVKAGQVLCIIEAMKLMNEIEADASGEVVTVLATNAQPVEYGESLFAIRADGK